MKKWFLLLYLVVLAVYDWKEQKIPLVMAGGGFVAALAMNIYRVIFYADNWKWLTLSILLGMLPGIYMLTVAYLTGKAGYGDGITLMNIGMLTNYKTCILLWGFSMVFLSFFSVVLLCLRKANKDTRIPYLPFLTAVYAVELIG